MIIWMHRVFRSQFPSTYFDGTITNHLIDIHISLSTGACLPHNQWKMTIQLPFRNLLTITIKFQCSYVLYLSGSLYDEVSDPLSHAKVCLVHLSTSFLQITKRMNHWILVDKDIVKFM